MAKELIVKNLTKKYGSFLAVNNLSFKIKEREIFALIGPNGAGKSTTLKMLSTVLSPSSGTATIDDLDLVKDSSQIRTITTYLPEEAGAYKNMTGIGYLEFMASLYADSKDRKKSYLLFAKEITGLKDRLKDKISTYSKGMTRKLLLARTVMSKPRLAILDEPTSGLDVLNALYVRRTIRDLSNHGMSVLLSSHNMLEIEFLSDRVALMHKGEIIETGTPSELMKRHSSKNLEEVFEKITDE